MKGLFVILLALVPWMAWAQQPTVVRGEDGTLLTSHHDVFDAHDRLAVRISYDYDTVGVVETRTLQSYDRQGRIRQKDIYSADEYLLFREVVSYDRQGRKRKVVQTSYDENDVPVKAVMTYRYRKDGTTQVLLNGHELVY